ncbi:MFS general substrate transporter [Mycena kentingensis (nom. inval.)]|nr:MFS general substrate transporter [Mycena kentingensis (nom. inval.)]
MATTRKNCTFWLILFSLCLSLFVSALELTAISTALPTIAAALNLSSQSAFLWVGNAYSLASTAFLPLSGGLAEIFGRRPAMLFSIACFALGSALCGSASGVPVFLAGRAVQGLGGGGIRSLAVIILADLVTLEERGVYGVLTGLTWCTACITGPVIGGALVTRGAWRWLFYLNLPICTVAAVFVLVFLRLPTPQGSFREKIGRLDLIGNILVISSTASCTLALTWAGTSESNSWTSPRVLVPLWCDPLVPFILVCNRTSLSGYIQAFIVGLVTLCVVYFLPLYFQLCAPSTSAPLHAAVLSLPLASLAPAAVVAGVLVSKTKRYRPQMWAGWVLIVCGLAGLSWASGKSTGRTMAFSALTGVGLGFEYSTTMFPVQAPLPLSQNARALAFLTFVSSFAGVWGLTIGGAVLDNQFAARVPAGVYHTYALTPETSQLPSNVQNAFAESLGFVWAVLAGLAGIGLFASLWMDGLPLHSTLDENWTLEAETAVRRNARSGVLRFEMARTAPIVQIDFNTRPRLVQRVQPEKF